MPAQPDTCPATDGASFGSGLAALRAIALALIAAALVAVLPAGPARSQSDPVVAKVNGRSITMGEVETAIKARPAVPVELPHAQKAQMQFDVLCMLIDGAQRSDFIDQLPFAPHQNTKTNALELAALTAEGAAKWLQKGDYARAWEQFCLLCAGRAPA